MTDQSGRELALKTGLFRSHSVILGSVAGAFLSLILGVFGAPLILLLLAPFAAGLLAGSVGNGAKAGILSVIFSVLLLVPTSLMLPVQNVNLPSDVSGVGIVGGTFAALTNGLLGSARVTMSGFAALFSSLGQILMILVLLSLVLVAGVAMVASAIVGAIGGLVGQPLRRTKQIQGPTV